MRSKRRRLLTGALEADPAQRALELGHLGSDALEVVIRERKKPHRGARDDRRRPLSRQEKSDLAEPVAGTEGLSLLTAIGSNSSLSLLDEVDGGSVVVERDDLDTSVNTDLSHRFSERVELRIGKIREEWEGPNSS